MPEPAATAPGSSGSASDGADDAPAVEPAPTVSGTNSPGGATRGAGVGNDNVPTYDQAASTPGANLPELKLDLHAYAANPADRFVFLNMAKLKGRRKLPGRDPGRGDYPRWCGAVLAGLQVLPAAPVSPPPKLPRAPGRPIHKNRCRCATSSEASVMFDPRVHACPGEGAQPIGNNYLQCRFQCRNRPLRRRLPVLCRRPVGHVLPKTWYC